MRPLSDRGRVEVDMLARYVIDLDKIDQENLVVVSELGFAKKARGFAEKLDARKRAGRE